MSVWVTSASGRTSSLKGTDPRLHCNLYTSLTLVLLGGISQNSQQPAVSRFEEPVTIDEFERVAMLVFSEAAQFESSPTLDNSKIFGVEAFKRQRFSLYMATGLQSSY